MFKRHNTTKENKKIVEISEIRKSWFNIFFKYNYHFFPPSSLIPPKEDKSLLFINSGVAVLKKYFSNSNLLPKRNLVNCQPVVRLSDLDQIDKTFFHQTLFEMLGCFSVGGNFKEETIPIVWEWLTSQNWLSLSKKKLFITVWEEDKESYKIWEKVGVKKKNIFLGNKETNFWDMGDGPCGPNTEVYFQLGQKIPNSIVDLDENKNFIEIGNLVFPDLYHKENEYYSLTEKAVDVGMGLERIAAVKQRKKYSFYSDQWLELVTLVNNLLIEKTSKSENKQNS